MTSNPPANRRPDQSSSTSAPQAFDFKQLAQGATEVIVEYEGQQYRLRLTKNGKLILNK